MANVFEDGAQEQIAEAYEDVRKDGSETMWCYATYPDGGKTIAYGGSGVNYDELLEVFADDARIYAYARFETGDEMSRRAKFAFITWIGPSVSPLKKAKVSTDKAFVKQIIHSFGKEILADEKSEVSQEKVAKILEKASGAAYGTGK